MSEKKLSVDVSVWTVLKVLLTLVAFYLVFLIRDIIALLFIVLILVAAFNPVIDRWETKMRRSLAVGLLFAIVILVIAGVISIIVPSLVDQITQLVEQLPQIFSRFKELKSYIPNFEQNLSNLSKSLTDLTGGFVSVTAGVFGGVFTLLTAIVITAYLLIDKDAFAQFVVSILPVDNKDQIITIFDKIGQRLGNWLRGQLLLGAIIAAADLIGLMIIGIPYALTLALIGGFLELVPTIGPIAAGAVAVIVALVNEPVKAIFVVILYVVVQQLENNFIVPKVMQKAVGLSPVIIIFAILIGAKLLGITGAILAVPLAGSISVLVQEWPKLRKTFNNND